jgi:hypothetical protein
VAYAGLVPVKTTIMQAIKTEELNRMRRLILKVLSNL